MPECGVMGMSMRVSLWLVPEGADVERGKKLLEKAESSCLVTNSLNSEVHLTMEIALG